MVYCNTLNNDSLGSIFSRLLFLSFLLFYVWESKGNYLDFLWLCSRMQFEQQQHQAEHNAYLGEIAFSWGSYRLWWCKCSAAAASSSSYLQPWNINANCNSLPLCTHLPVICIGRVVWCVVYLNTYKFSMEILIRFFLNLCNWSNMIKYDKVAFMMTFSNTTLFENCSKYRIWIFFNFGIFHLFLSGNTVWPQASGFQKLAKLDHFWHF